MMNKQIKYFTSALFVAFVSAAFTSCDDWTEPEPVDVNYGTIEQAPGYEEYCAKLREYRKSDHRKVYAWLNIPATGPADQSQRLTAVPDSVDVIVLDNPSEIHPTTLSDIRKVQSTKGMDVIYTIDFDAIKTEHTLLCENLGAERTALQEEIDQLTAEYEADENKDDETVKAEYEEALAALEAKIEAAADPDFYDYLLAGLTEQLKYVKANGLSGVMFAFNGKMSNHLSPAELAEYQAQQLVFLGAARDWHKRNPELRYDFLGYPQNVSDKDILNEFGMLFIRQGLDATNKDQFNYYYTLAQSEGVPVERLGMVSVYPSADPEDKTGYLKDGTLAVEALINFALTSDIAGVGVYGIQRDYFGSPSYNYPYLRKLIGTVNPRIK